VNPADDLAALARVTASLVVVVVLAVLVARLARRAGTRGPGVGVRVVDRAGLSREAAVAVVEVGGRALVLGVTSHTVSVLTELDPEQLEAARVRPEPGATEPAGPGPATGMPWRSPRLQVPGRPRRTVRAPVPPPAVLRRRTDVEPEPPILGAPPPGAPHVATPPAARTTRTTPVTPAGTGAALDPRTWRHGLDALRDLTVRR